MIYSRMSEVGFHESLFMRAAGNEAEIGIYRLAFIGHDDSLYGDGKDYYTYITIEIDIENKTVDFIEHGIIFEYGKQFHEWDFERIWETLKRLIDSESWKSESPLNGFTLHRIDTFYNNEYEIESVGYRHTGMRRYGFSVI